MEFICGGVLILPPSGRMTRAIVGRCRKKGRDGMPSLDDLWHGVRCLRHRARVGVQRMINDSCGRQSPD
jgi:hypothetical protein